MNWNASGMVCSPPDHAGILLIVACGIWGLPLDSQPSSPSRDLKKDNEEDQKGTIFRLLGDGLTHRASFYGKFIF